MDDDALFGGGGIPQQDGQDLATLSDLGFTAKQAKVALKKFPGDATRAANYLMSPSRFKDAGNAEIEIVPDSPQYVFLKQTQNIFKLFLQIFRFCTIHN